VAQLNPTLRKTGLIMFSIASLLAILLILARAIPDLESTMYGFIKYDYPRLTSLACPVLMTTQDSLPVTIRLHNSLDRNLKWFVEAQFSAPYMIETNDQTLELQPGESRKLSWEVDNQNVDLGFFIFARVFSSAATTAGMREATCGTLVLNLPFGGGPVIFYGLLVISVILAGVGFLLWKRNALMSDDGVTSRFWWMRFMSIVLVVGLVTALINSWFAALVMVMLAILCTAVYMIPRKV
jgi:hypothetical protein